jgi:hypothetical protein
MAQTASTHMQIQGNARPLLPDRLTLIAVSSLAYVVAVALHEYLGHAAACTLLGSHPTQMGAFYIDCDDSRLSSPAIRLVALAGPLVSLITGATGSLLVRRLKTWEGAGWYFTWLLGTLGLMSAAGYPLFSGISGMGDLGVTRDGALYGAQPEWLWRILLTVAGLAAYWAAVRVSLRTIEPRAAGLGPGRIRCARLAALISYLTGAAVSLAIGLLNPQGIAIVVTSALASSAGGSSGLLWMMQLMDRQREVVGQGLYFPRRWGWIAAGGAITIAYAAIFGPTLQP